MSNKYNTIEEVSKDFELHIHKSRAGTPQRFVTIYLKELGVTPDSDYRVASVINNCYKKTVKNDFIIKKANEYYDSKHKGN